MEEVKGEVVREVRRRTGKSRPWLTCSLVVLAMLVGLFVWAAWTVAATGLVRVPVFTSLAFEEPAPLRTVVPGVGVETVLQEAFQTTLTRRLYEGGGTLVDREIEVELDERSLTATLRTFLEEAGMEWIDASRVQIAVEPGVGVELFVPLMDTGSGLRTTVRVLFSIEVKEEGVVIVPGDIHVGSAKIPGPLVAAFAVPLLEAELAKLNTAVVGYARIDRIETLPGALRVTGELAVEVQER